MGFIINPYRFATAGGGPTFSNVKLLVHGGGANATSSFTDLSTGAHTLTANGNAQYTSGTTIGGENAILLDGTGDFISTPSSTDFNVSNNIDFCIEAYIILDATGRIHTILNNRPSSLAKGYTFAVNSTNKLIFQVFDGTAASLTVNGATSLSSGTLYHVAAIRQGVSNGTGYVFINGVVDGSAVKTSPTVSDSITTMFIGRDGTTTARDFQGKMNWLRLTIGETVYLVTGFTPPSMPYPTS